MNALSDFFLESRLRFFYCLWCFLFTFFWSYLYQIELLYCVGRPFLELHHKFIFIDLTEAFYTVLRVCVSLSLVLCAPFVVYQMWSFFLPSFYQCESKEITCIVLLFSVLLCFEIIVIYHVFLPHMCSFLLSFEMSSPNMTFQNHEPHLFHADPEKNILEDFPAQKKEISPCLVIELNARIESSIHLFSQVYFYLCLFFQIPFVFFLFFKNNVLTAYDLCKNRKYFMCIAFLLAAALSPPDISSQCILYCVMFLVYEIGVVIGLFFSLKKSFWIHPG